MFLQYKYLQTHDPKLGTVKPSLRGKAIMAKGAASRAINPKARPLDLGA
jgi:hypothetical protein